MKQLSSAVVNMEEGTGLLCGLYTEQFGLESI